MHKILNSEIADNIEKKFTEVFNNNPLLIKAPGRINLIGEHTDYNDGFVLPAAIDKHIAFAVAKNNEGIFRFVSEDLNESIETEINNIKPSDKHWANYLLGVIAQIHKLGKQISGVDCVFGGNIPLGAGLSSSAALESGFLFALNKLFQLNLSKLEMAQMAQMAEHEYAGVKCGIMDQFASIHGKKDHVIRLDCRSLEYELFPLNLKGYDILLCDTNVKHSLASSEYNTRRQECEEGVAVIKEQYGQVKNLRDVNPEMIKEFENKLKSNIYKRCKYVVEENNRLLMACEALTNNNISRFGELMYETHEGLKNNYQVSCKELDILVNIAKESEMVIGSRMMGGGFGGCTINIVDKNKTAAFKENVKREYQKQTGIELLTYVVSIENGVSTIE